MRAICRLNHAYVTHLMVGACAGALETAQIVFSHLENPKVVVTSLCTETAMDKQGSTRVGGEYSQPRTAARTPSAQSLASSRARLLNAVVALSQDLAGRAHPWMNLKPASPARGTGERAFPCKTHTAHTWRGISQANARARSALESPANYVAKTTMKGCAGAEGWCHPQRKEERLVQFRDLLNSDLIETTDRRVPRPACPARPTGHPWLSPTTLSGWAPL